VMTTPDRYASFIIMGDDDTCKPVQHFGWLQLWDLRLCLSYDGDLGSLGGYSSRSGRHTSQHNTTCRHAGS
jgi:hypothetical protein